MKLFSLALLFAAACFHSTFLSAATLHNLKPNQIESAIAGEDGPGGRYYSLRAYGGGAHDLLEDIPGVQRSGSKVLSAYFKDTGRRWVYLGTRKSGHIQRSFFDLGAGVVGERGSEHRADIAAIGGGWYRVSISYNAADVTSVHLGIAGGNGSPYFSANPGVDRVFLSAPELSDGTAAPAPARAAGPRSMQKGLWVWRAEPVLNVNKRTELLTFMLNKGLNTAYIDARIPVMNNHYMLSEFIRTFQSRGISVELMFGKPEWALRDHHHEVLSLIDQAVEYTRRYPAARPTAIHLDIEAHLIREWQDQRNWVANQFIDLIAQARHRSAAVSLPLVIDMPVWWDTFSIVREGVSRPLHQWVIDGADRIALMDYRDTEERIVNDAGDELRYASSRGKEIVVGVETMCIPPEMITFCEEGSANMEWVLQRVDGRLPVNDSYRGFAVHHYETYRTMRR
ncbi:hypothetical protein HCU74_12270 [Spongiibacter sp. KMU-166]|uniref:Uncharacterized protein n=1 Tax=Spongiibacter thalassae TaxID=2721624 RepID=A0ABX1GGX7_9GAMM|nr:hypothetical protein [Spongiibacter thalassae]NKI18181.1 hypothetical protein [Spongiibacter thalassae]